MDIKLHDIRELWGHVFIVLWIGNKSAVIKYIDGEECFESIDRLKNYSTTYQP